MTLSSLRLCAPLLAVLTVGLAAQSQPGTLIQAVRAGDRVGVQRLLNSRVNVNALDGDGATGLHWAANLDHVDIAKALTRAGADPNLANIYGVTPLHLACLNGSAEMAELLLKAGANATAAVGLNGETALMTAARTGNVAAVAALLAHGADANAQERSRKQTPLMWAAAENRADVVRMLTKHGADIHLRSTGGFNALLFAARDAGTDTVSALVAAGDDVNGKAPDGTTALLVATASNNFPVVDWLLKHGADPNAADNIGMTPLHAATWRQFAQAKLVDLLLHHGARPNARLVKAPPQAFHDQGLNVAFLPGATPFLLAASAADMAVMRALLAGGADPLVTTNDGSTALMAAAGKAYQLGIVSITTNRAITFAEASETIKLLVELGVDPAASSDKGETALHFLANNAADDLIRFLVSKGADVNAADLRGIAPMAVAKHANIGATVLEQKSTIALLRELGAREVPPQPPRRTGGNDAAERPEQAVPPPEDPTRKDLEPALPPTGRY